MAYAVEAKTSPQPSPTLSEESLKEEDLSVVNRFDAQCEPQLDPRDLDDLAAIVDRLRVLFNKKEDSKAPKKLISKNSTKVDELAGAFDKKLTQIMVRLARILKDGLITKSQKWAEIEKSKFLLYNFCIENGLNLMLKNKGSMNSKDLKELHHAISKAREGLCGGFVNLGSLFY